MAPEPDVERAHRHSIRHRRELLASDVCGCFYCLRTFPPAALGESSWLHDGPDDATATCPHCSVDAVIGSASGFPITADFLRRMHDRWFGSRG